MGGPGEEKAKRFRETFERLRAEVSKVIVGQADVIEGVLVALFAGGHVLVEGVPGLGKTKLVRSLAAALKLDFGRVQFTPDLMPADIIGTEVIEESGGERRFRFEAGPVFTNVLLADEINRATPKTQSALLEAMGEGSVTVSGETHRLSAPFFVLATQNPIEMEGTYPLPEAQLDRFLFKLRVEMPSVGEMSEILERTTAGEEAAPAAAAAGEEIVELQAVAREVPAGRPVLDYVSRIVSATHPGGELAPPKVKELVRHGASPRAAQAMVLAGKVRALAAGRFNLAFEDVRRSATESLRHRLILNFEGELGRVTPDEIVEEVLSHVEPPRE